MYKFALALFAICIAVAVGTPTCTNYCTAFLANCNASNSQGINWYNDMANCMAVCAAFPIGTDNDTTGNTVGCRTYHAIFAGNPPSNAAVHCPHASSSGGLQCGDYCDAYCSIGRFNCNPTNGWPLEGSQVLWDQGDVGCHNICAVLYPVGSIGNDVGGNTLACRMYHAQASYSLGTYHCAHASPNGGLTCGTDPCINYCQQIFTTCPTIYTSNQTCMNYCNNNLKWNLGGFNTTTDDTLGCRIYHNGAVPALGTGHCLHADPSGGNNCGTYCTVYCDLIQKNCVGAQAQFAYPDTATCMSACANMPSNAPDTAVSGDSVQCRIYHAGVAGNPITNAPVHCPHASKDGAGTCGGTPPPTTGSTGGSTTKGSGASSVAASVVLIVVALVAALL